MEPLVILDRSQLDRSHGTRCLRRLAERLAAELYLGHVRMPELYANDNTFYNF